MGGKQLARGAKDMPLIGAWRHILCEERAHPAVCETLAILALDKCVVYEDKEECNRILTLYRLHGCDAKEGEATPIDFLPPVG